MDLVSVVDGIYQEKLQEIYNKINTKVSCNPIFGQESLFAQHLSDVQNRAEAQTIQQFPITSSSDVSYRENCAAQNTSTSFDDIILRAAKEYNLDPSLIKAVIQTESSFNANAVSSAGAQGLMQLMPGTARGLGVNNSFDPEQNIFGGTAYIRQQLDRFGDIRLALAAYNTGPGRISSLNIKNANDANEYSKISSGVRGYVDKVLKNYRNFNGS